MSLRKFGVNVGPILNKQAKTFQQIYPAFVKNKQYIYNTKNITLHWAKKGSGLTEAR